MDTPHGSRAARFAAEFEVAQRDLIRVIESLSDEQWRRVGRNFPQRLNDEDEHRSVGVIAHHVAVNTPRILDRIERMLDGRPLPPADFAALNALHASEHADVSREEVLALLRGQQAEVAAIVRAIPDDQLDLARDTPVGPMSIAQRLDRVLVGHIRMHLGSIEAAIG
jgi:DinB superfamily